MPDADALLSSLWSGLNNRQKVNVNLLKADDVELLQDGARQFIVINVPKAARRQRPVYLNNRPLEETYRRDHSGDYPFPYFDRLADGAWLVADDIAKKGKSNAALFSADGTLTAELKLGGDIQHVQADPDGGFWIGYGDRGVFSGPHRVEAGGVVRFDADGKPVWNINESDAKRCHAWCDHSYAMNISAAGRWCYTYTEFLLTQLDADGGPHSLRPMIHFADAVAIKDGRIMMAGGAGDGVRGHGYDRLVLLGEPGRWTPRRPRMEWIATVHRAINPEGHLWTARGDTLHCVRGKTWHRLSIDEADGAVPVGPWRNPRRPLGDATRWR